MPVSRISQRILTAMARELIRLWRAQGFTHVNRNLSGEQIGLLKLSIEGATVSPQAGISRLLTSPDALAEVCQTLSNPYWQLIYLIEIAQDVVSHWIEQDARQVMVSTSFNPQLRLAESIPGPIKSNDRGVHQDTDTLHNYYCLASEHDKTAVINYVVDVLEAGIAKENFPNVMFCLRRPPS